MTERRATAVACANIALAKYWGKSDVSLNLPAVPSLSLTLAEMRTETTVAVDSALSRDELELNGRVASENELARVAAAVRVLGSIDAY